MSDPKPPESDVERARRCVAEIVGTLLDGDDGPDVRDLACDFSAVRAEAFEAGRMEGLHLGVKRGIQQCLDMTRNATQSVSREALFLLFYNPPPTPETKEGCAMCGGTGLAFGKHTRARGALEVACPACTPSERLAR
jgi:hypothetical protein